jgi:hypothetical protein
MITPFLIDEIARIRRVFDINGASTDSTKTGIKARVEDYNGMVRNNEGQEVICDMLIMTKPDEDIIEGDLLMVKKKNGVAYHLPNKKFTIKKIENAAGFMASHREIYI